MKKLMALAIVGSVGILSAAGYQYQGYNQGGYNQGYDTTANYGTQDSYSQTRGYSDANYNPDFQRSDRSSTFSRPDYDQNRRDTTLSQDQTARGASNDQFFSDEDRKLGKKIRDELAGGWFTKSYDNITVSVRDGNVTLRGTVPTQEDKNKVVEKVGNIEGIRNINNLIMVQGDRGGTDRATYGQPADRNMRGQPSGTRY